MAWEARSGLKLYVTPIPNARVLCRNGLGSPFGIETFLNGLQRMAHLCRNGLGSPFGIETLYAVHNSCIWSRSEWPGKPVRDCNFCSIIPWTVLCASSEWPGKPVRCSTILDH